jgi:thiosulfate dehydrogenase
MPELDRAADPVRGKAIYANACLACHNTDGSGIRRSLPTTDLGYMVPPLWGSDNFNDGAGRSLPRRTSCTSIRTGRTT